MTISGESSTLTQKILEYKKTGKDLQELIEQVALLVYSYPASRLRWSEDDCSDFFCWFFPKIPSLIDRFQFIGKDFEAYLYITLKWQCRTFSVKQLETRKLHTIAQRREFWPRGWQEDQFVSDHTPGLLTEAGMKLFRVEGKKITDTTSKRRLMYITLKGADYITAHIVETVAVLTGIDEGWLYTCIEGLKKGMASKKRRMEQLRRKRNRAYMRIYHIHEKLFHEFDSQAKELLLQQLEDEKIRLAAIIDVMNRVPASPTHKDIAGVLGIPKGSVDSGIYYLKNSLEDICA